MPSNLPVAAGTGAPKKKAPPPCFLPLPADRGVVNPPRPPMRHRWTADSGLIKYAECYCDAAIVWDGQFVGAFACVRTGFTFERLADLTTATGRASLYGSWSRATALNEAWVREAWSSYMRFTPGLGELLGVGLVLDLLVYNEIDFRFNRKADDLADQGGRDRCNL